MTGGVDGQSRFNPSTARLATAAVTLLLGVYWIALFYGTHSTLPPGMLPGNSDKYVHFTSYAGLGVLLMSLRAIRGTYSWKSVFARWFVLVAYGAFDELTQMLVNRTADFRDWYADICGAACGLAAVTFVVWSLYRSNAARDAEAPADAVAG